MRTQTVYCRDIVLSLTTSGILDLNISLGQRSGSFNGCLGRLRSFGARTLRGLFCSVITVYVESTHPTLPCQDSCMHTANLFIERPTALLPLVSPCQRSCYSALMLCFVTDEMTPRPKTRSRADDLQRPSRFHPQCQDASNRSGHHKCQ